MFSKHETLSMVSAFRYVRKIAEESLILNSVSWVGARAISGLTRIGILLAIARIYGPRSFGQISLSLSLIEILRTFSEFGIDTISIRKFVQIAPEERASILPSLAGTKLILATCFYAIGGFVLFGIVGDRTELYLGAELGLTLFFAGLVGTLSSYLQSSFSMSRILRTTVVSSLASIVFAFIALHDRAPALVTLAALPLADGLNALFLWLRSGVPFRLKFGVQEPLSILRESLPVGLMAVFVILYFRVDNLLVFKFAGASALGLYAVCYRIIEPALMVPASFSATTYSLLSAPRQQGMGADEVRHIVLKTMWPAYVFVFAISVLLLLSGKWFLLHFLPGYLRGFPILVVLTGALLVRSVNVGLTAVLNSRAKYSALARIAAGTFLLNLLVVFCTVPIWGALGAAWAAVLTEVFNTLLQGRSLVLLFISPSPGRALENVPSSD